MRTFPIKNLSRLLTHAFHGARKMQEKNFVAQAICRKANWHKGKETPGKCDYKNKTTPKHLTLTKSALKTNFGFMAQNGQENRCQSIQTVSSSHVFIQGSPKIVKPFITEFCFLPICQIIHQKKATDTALSMSLGILYQLLCVWLCSFWLALFW